MQRIYEYFITENLDSLLEEQRLSRSTRIILIGTFVTIGFCFSLSIIFFYVINTVKVFLKTCQNCIIYLPIDICLANPKFTLYVSRRYNISM